MNEVRLTEIQILDCQKNLADAKSALHDLLTGQQVAQVGYGDRQLRYTQASINELRAYIQQLETQCGNCAANRRRPFRVIW